MNTIYKKIKYTEYSVLFIIANGILGLSILNNWILLGIFAVSLMYIYEQRLLQKNFWVHFVSIVVGTSLIFISTTFWFINISASGWSSKIWILDPSAWLFIVIVICSLFASLFVAILRISLRLINNKTKPSNYLYPLCWAVLLMLSEIALSYSLAFIIKGNGVPLRPSWNFSSSALLVSINVFTKNISGVLGFWGTSYLMYLVLALFIESISKYLKSKKVNYIFMPAVLIITVVISVSLIATTLQKDTNNQTVKAYYVSSKDSSNSYLDSLIDSLNISKEQPTLIVLPEYSSLIRPFPEGPLNNINKDYREELKNKIKNTNTIVIGTEDEYIDGKKSPMTYILNNNLDVIYKKPKEFLVPGGEYMTPWIAELMKKVDKTSVNRFYAERGKSVVKQKNDYPQNVIGVGIGACSANITPYFYQKQVVNNIEILASNLSFAQFKTAPEYERYTERFAKFISASLNKPMIISSVQGNSFVFSKDGSPISKSLQEVNSIEISSNRSNTIYGILGDFYIVSLIILTNLIVIIFIYYKNHFKIKLQKKK